MSINVYYYNYAIRELSLGLWLEHPHSVPVVVTWCCPLNYKREDEKHSVNNSCSCRRLLFTELLQESCVKA